MYLYVERIRDFLGYALYKFTFYLLTTYLLTLDSIAEIGRKRRS